MQQLNLDIMEYVENHILPRYADFGKSHGLSHVMRVIKTVWNWLGSPVLI